MVIISRGIDQGSRLKVEGSKFNGEGSDGAPRTARPAEVRLFLFLGRLFLGFFFLFDFHGAGAIDSAKRSKAALAKGAFALQLGLSLDGEAGPGNGCQTSFGDRFAGQLAFAVSVFLNPFEGLFDSVEGVLVGETESQG